VSRGPRWTPDDEARLREMHTAGWSVPRVMHALGRTRNAVYTRSANMGLGRWGRALRLPPAGSLADEIEAAKRERATAPLFRPGGRL
jgi:hypothetical protein